MLHVDLFQLQKLHVNVDVHVLHVHVDVHVLHVHVHVLHVHVYTCSSVSTI